MSLYTSEADILYFEIMIGWRISTFCQDSSFPRAFFLLPPLLFSFFAFLKVESSSQDGMLRVTCLWSFCNYNHCLLIYNCHNSPSWGSFALMIHLLLKTELRHFSLLDHCTSYHESLASGPPLAVKLFVWNKILTCAPLADSSIVDASLDLVMGLAALFWEQFTKMNWLFWLLNDSS